MKKIYTFIAVMFAAFAVNAQCDDIFISEVTEGSGNNKYMELYNGTGATVYLDDYGLANTSNAPTTVGEYEFWLSFPAGDSILPGGTYVVGHGSADSIIVANTDLSHNFLSNGDDGYKLVKGGTWNDANTDGDIDAGEMTGFTVVDQVGDWQGDPGAGWAVAGVADATKDHTLVRKSWYGGNSNWAMSAGTDSASSEWWVIDMNDWSGLGSHRSICTGIQNPGYDIEGDDSYRDYWRNLDFEDQLPNTNLLQITSSPVHMGAKAGKFPSSGDRIAYQAVTVKPYTNYKIKFWYTIKTNNTGSATVHILEGDIRDTLDVPGAIITSKTVSDQTSANDYVQDSVEFTSGAMDQIAIYLRNEGEECRFDTWEIEEGQPPVVAAIKNPGFDIEGSDSYRDFWRNSSFEDSASSSAMIQITSGPTHNGSPKAAKLPSDGSRAGYQAVEVAPNTDYIVTYWYTMKTSPAGSATVAILGMDLVDPADVPANTIASRTVSDQTDANTFIKDSVGFNSGSSSEIAIYFTNMGVETRFDTWDIYEGTIAVTEPMTAAPDPTHAAEDVISIYSESYTDPAGINYYPNWGQSTQYSVFEIGMDSMIKYSSINYQGIDFNASEIDASSMEMLHIDIWTADVDDIDIFPISRASGEKAVKKTLTAGEWNSIDIPLTDYTSQGLSMDDIFQFKFDNLGASRGTGTIFIDNMYLWKEPTLVYKVADIADIVGLNADFYPSNYDTLYEVTGIVYGIDLQGGDDLTNDRVAFTVIDATDGVGVFSGSSLGYTVNEGDEVTVKGPLGFFNGLTQIIADSITLVSTGNDIKDATEVTTLDESTESDLVMFTKVWFVDNTITEWPSGNSDLTNGTDTFAVRIDSDTKGIIGSAIFDTMDIVGLGGQFDGSAPYDEGYQLFPRDSSDIKEWKTSSVKNINKVQLGVYPNPTTGEVKLLGNIKWNSYRVYNAIGVEVMSGKLEGQVLNLEGLKNGYYFIEASNNESTGVSKVILNK